MHGESLGGCVAAYIAKKCKVDFVFVDRTFANLLDVAYWGVGGRTTRFLLWLFTRWNTKCWLNYWEIKDCYKLLGCDSEDKIITDLSSVRNALTKKILKDRLL